MKKYLDRAASTASAIAIGALMAASAHADGLYAGGSVGGSNDRGGDIAGLNTDHSDTGYKLYGGYSFNPYFGLEAGYADLGRFHGDGGTLRARGLFMDAVGTYPLVNNFSLLGRVGVFTGRLNQNLSGNTLVAPSYDSGTGTSYKFGAGLQYDITKAIALRGEWERYRFDAIDMKPNTNLLSVGLNYRF